MRVGVEDPERGHVDMPGIPARLSLTPGAIRGAAPRLGEHEAIVQSAPPRPVPHGDPPHPKGPLEGLRILDLGVVIAGTFPGTLLGELGADDIKVEPPGGDSLRNFAPTFLGYNKGKRSMAVDLQKPGGREVFHRLVREADIVFDNYRPGVLERLGLDYETLRAIKPDIICVSVTANGETGPLRDEPGFDPVFQAGSGMMLAQGGGEPCFITTPVTDTPTALMAALGACLALYHRRRTGLGQRATTSLAAASVMMQSSEIVEFAGRPDARMGGRDFQGPSAFDRYYAVRDGIIRVRAVTDRERAGLATAGFVRTAALTAGEDDSQEQLTRTFAATSREEALARLRDAGVPAVPTAKAFRECYEGQPEPKQPWMEWITLGNGATVLAAGRYLELSRTPIEGPTVAPGLGEHTTPVLQEGGFSAEEIAGLIAAGVVRQGAAFAL
jgi:crotonobetainyl-CoA:carnitine CoA-transferase CaiB-like acyl-CoA transferase